MNFPKLKISDEDKEKLKDVSNKVKKIKPSKAKSSYSKGFAKQEIKQVKIL
jgi:hypothetical protein